MCFKETDIAVAEINDLTDEQSVYNFWLTRFVRISYASSHAHETVYKTAESEQFRLLQQLRHSEAA